MPETFPTYNPLTDELEDREFYTLDETAARFHVSRSFVYERCRHGVWDCLRVGRNYYLSAAQIGAAMDEMQTHNRPAGFSDEPVQLGEPVADAEIESIR